jgi:DUF971 family protein
VADTRVIIITHGLPVIFGVHAKQGSLQKEQ